jgi:hypothetical protein
MHPTLKFGGNPEGVFRQTLDDRKEVKFSVVATASQSDRRY